MSKEKDALLQSHTAAAYNPGKSESAALAVFPDEVIESVGMGKEALHDNDFIRLNLEKFGIIPDLDDLQKLSRDKLKKLLERAISPLLCSIDKLEFFNAEQYAEILTRSFRADNSPFSANQARSPRRADLNLLDFHRTLRTIKDAKNFGTQKDNTRDLCSYLYWIVYISLRNDNNPLASYYCSLSSIGNTKASHPDLFKYNTLQYHEKTEIAFLPKNLTKIIEYYKEILHSKASAPELKNIAEIKIIKLSGKTLQDIIKRIEGVRHNPLPQHDSTSASISENLRQIIKMETSWIQICDEARKFKSSDPKIQKLLDCLRLSSSTQCPSLEKDKEQCLEIQGGLYNKIIARLEILAGLTKKADRYSVEVIGKNPVFKALSIHDEKYRSLATDVEKDPDCLYELHTQMLLQTNIKPENPPDNQEQLKDSALQKGIEKISRLVSTLFKNEVQVSNMQDHIKESAQELLIEAALAGNSVAQYKVAQKYLTQYRMPPATEARAASATGHRTKRYLLERYYYFISLAAKHNIDESPDEEYRTKIIMARNEMAQAIETEEIEPWHPFEAEICYMLNAKQGDGLGLQKYKIIKDQILDTKPESLSKDRGMLLLMLDLERDDEDIAMRLANFYHSYQVDFAKAIEICERLAETNQEAKFRLFILNFQKEENGIEYIEKINEEQFLKDLLPKFFNNDEPFHGNDSSENKMLLDLAIQFNNKISNLLKPQRAALKDIQKIANDAIEKFAKVPFSFARAQLILLASKEDNTANTLISLTRIINDDQIKTEEKEIAISKISKLLSNKNILQHDSDLELSEEDIVNLVKIFNKQNGGDAQSHKIQSLLIQRLSEISVEGKPADYAKNLQGQIITLLEKVNGRVNAKPEEQEALLHYFCNGSYNPNFAQIKHFESYPKNLKKKYAQEIAIRLYKAGEQIDESERDAYKNLFQTYFELTAEKEALRAECSNWVKDTKIKNKAPQQAFKDVSEAIVVKEASKSAAAAEIAVASPDLAAAATSDITKEKPAKTAKKTHKKEKKPTKEEKKKQKQILKASKVSLYPLLPDDNSSDAAQFDEMFPDELASENSATFGEASGPQTSSPETSFSSEAREFSPQTLQSSEGEAMAKFLESRNKIYFITDLPEFLRDRLFDLVKSGHKVLLKGSAVYQNQKNKRVPSDLDVEILVDGMSSWKNEEIKDFVTKNFGAKELKIFNTKTSFTVSFKDDNDRLDIAFYDPRKQDPSHLGWTNSKELRIEFDKYGSAEYINPRGFDEYIADNGIKFNKKTDFVINPQARKLILRLAFLQTTEVVSFKDTEVALTRLEENPIDLLLREFQVDKLLGRMGSRATEDNIKEHVKQQIQGAMDSHFAGEDSDIYKKAFIDNLSQIANFKNPNAKKSYSSGKENILQAIAEMASSRNPADAVQVSFAARMHLVEKSSQQ